MGVTTILSEDKILIKELEGQEDFRIALYISKSKLTLQYLHCINYVLMVLLLTSPSVHSLSFAGWNHPCFHCSVPSAPSYWKLWKKSQLHNQGIMDLTGSSWPILLEKSLFISFPRLHTPLFPFFSNNLWLSMMCRGTVSHSEVVQF